MRASRVSARADEPNKSDRLAKKACYQTHCSTKEDVNRFECAASRKSPSEVVEIEFGDRPGLPCCMKPYDVSKTHIAHERLRLSAYLQNNERARSMNVGDATSMLPRL